MIIIFIEKCNGFFNSYYVVILHSIIQIPGISGNTGAGIENVKKSVETAVGSDILFSNE